MARQSSETDQNDAARDDATTQRDLRLALPKGRMYEGVRMLLSEAGINLGQSARSYRPTIGLDDCQVKLLKPQNIVEMLQLGSRDVGFAGADWVVELGAAEDGPRPALVELLDTELDPVRIVAATPIALLDAEGQLPRERSLVIASEYERLTRRWISDSGLQASFVRSYGATEVFPPEDADVIVDNTATGSTLAANGLRIVADLMRSSTRLYASPSALRDPKRKQQIDDLVLLLEAVLAARKRVMVEVNVSAENLEAVLAVLPAMRQATVSQLAGGSGYAVKAAVPREDLPRVIPRVKACGGTDVVVFRPAQIVP